ncbi:MAG TPA: hypothetical protein DIW37_02880 [Chryseobacterium sp.]|nr:hypothetical protein [Chryseobacterium sp.]
MLFYSFLTIPKRKIESKKTRRARPAQRLKRRSNGKKLMEIWYLVRIFANNAKDNSGTGKY